MKFVIDNYASGSNTQSLYLHKHVADNPHHEVVMNTFTTPIYDIMDSINPDVYITSCNTISKDLFIYLKQFQKKYNIKLLISTDESKVAHINKVDSMLKENNIEYKFFGNMDNPHIPNSIRSKTFKLANCTDINIMQDNSPETKWFKKINNLVVVDSKDDLDKLESVIQNTTYHILCKKSNMINDINFDIVGLCKHIFHNYDQVIFSNLDDGLHQMFFESLSRAAKTYFVSEKSEGISEKISKMLGDRVNLNALDKERTQDFGSIKKTVGKRHTSSNRTKSLLSQLPQKL
jgi:hypothetical protein